MSDNFWRPLLTKFYFYYRVHTMFHLPEQTQLVGQPQLVEPLSLAFTRCSKRRGSSRTRDTSRSKIKKKNLRALNARVVQSASPIRYPWYDRQRYTYVLYRTELCSKAKPNAIRKWFFFLIFFFFFFLNFSNNSVSFYQCQFFFSCR